MLTKALVGGKNLTPDSSPNPSLGGHLPPRLLGTCDDLLSGASASAVYHGRSDDPRIGDYWVGSCPDYGFDGPSYVRFMASVILTPLVGRTLQGSEGLVTHPIYGSRPLLRGRLHQAAALVSIPAGVHIVIEVAGPQTRLAASVYALTCTLMFTASAAYHRLAQGILARFWMRRLDHSMILIHIAGATTPIALIGVGGGAGRALLIASWRLGLLGGAMKMTGLTADRDPCPWCFAVMGWLPLLAIPSLVATLGPPSAALLAATVATYTAGAICFSRKTPDPIPTMFGYHEVWHVFTLIAGGLQLLLTIQLAAI